MDYFDASRPHLCKLNTIWQDDGYGDLCISPPELDLYLTRYTCEDLH